MKPIFSWISKNLYILLSILALSMVALNIKIYYKLSDFDNQGQYWQEYRDWLFEEDEFVQMAAKMWSENSKEPVDSIKKTSYPNVIELRTDVCVSLFPFGLGGVPVYCFDKKSKKPTYVHQDVE